MFRHAFAIAVFILLGLTAAVRADDFRDHFVAADPPQPLPDFVFEDNKGQSLHIGDFHGHMVLLNLWASWCSPCVEEMPTLDKLQKLMGPKLVIIALDEERNATPDIVKIFFKRHEIAYLQVFNDPSSHIAPILHARGLPMSFLIDAEGREIGSVEGAVDWSDEDVVAFMRQHLAKRDTNSY